jgi:hypothetical protein
MVVTRRAADLNAERQTAPVQKEDLFSDLDRFRRRWNCFSCQTLAFLIVVVCIGLVGWGVWLTAATGFVTVPFVSAYAYPTDPSPTRPVVPLQTGSGGIYLAQKLESLGLDPKAKSVSVELSENEITGLLREPDESGSVPLKQGQLAISPGSAELYGQLPIQHGERAVTVRLTLITNGPKLEITGITIGYVTLPIKLSRTVLSAVGASLPGLSFERFGITSMTFQQSNVRVTIDPSKLPLDEATPQERQAVTQ